MNQRYTLHDLKHAIAAGSAGRTDEALQICHGILESDPGYAPAWHLLGFIELERGNPDAARRIIAKALSLDPRLPLAHYHLGVACLRLALLPEARDAFRQAALIHPDSPQANTAIADLELKLGNPSGARSALAAARRVGGTGAGLERLEALAAAQLGRLDAAVEALRALAEGGDAASWEMLADLLARAGDDAALGDALGRAPALPALDLQRARLARRQGAGADARRLLAALSAGDDRDLAWRARFELGALADAEGDHAAAWEQWRAGNEAVAALAPPPHPDRPAFGEWLARVGARLDLASLATSRRAAPAGPAPVMLFGFPRSGTTLLGTMLAAHGALRVVEESGAAARMLDSIEARGRRYPEGLVALDGAVIAAMQDDYSTAMAAVVGTEVALDAVVDKNPLLTPYLPLLWSAYPGARLVFVQRHPLDVLRSCYAFGFAPGTPLAGRADVAELARELLATHELWERVRGALPLQVHTVRYEELVASPEPTLRALCAALGIEWRPAMLRFDDHARQRRLATNNPETIVRPLFASSVGGWQRNAAELEPARAVLAPLLERLGYA
jgi:tetratricopeptide (TPR) repeat protein